MTDPFVANTPWERPNQDCFHVSRTRSVLFIHSPTDGVSGWGRGNEDEMLLLPVRMQRLSVLLQLPRLRERRHQHALHVLCVFLSVLHMGPLRAVLRALQGRV